MTSRRVRRLFNDACRTRFQFEMSENLSLLHQISKTSPAFILFMDFNNCTDLRCIIMADLLSHCETITGIVPVINSTWCIDYYVFPHMCRRHVQQYFVLAS